MRLGLRASGFGWLACQLTAEEPYGGPATNFLAKEATGGWVTTTIDL